MARRGFIAELFAFVRANKAWMLLPIIVVLLLSTGSGTLIGRPLVEGARVLAEVVDFPRVKTMTQKFRRRKNYRRLKGHTQPHVRVKVTHILGSGEATPPQEKKADAPAPAKT